MVDKITISIKDHTKVSLTYIMVWLCRTYTFNYVTYVKFKFRAMKFGTMLTGIFSIFTGFLFAYVVLQGDFKTLEKDLDTIDEMILLQKEKESELC